jgi:hypothetical protein
LVFRRDRVLPVDIAQRIRKSTKPQCVELLGNTVLLLIRIDDPGSDLARGLADSSSLDGDRIFASVELEGTGTMTRAMHVDEMRAPDPPPAPLTVNTLRRRLHSATHFVAPLLRRRMPDRPVQQQISVGRGEYNDLVLRDATVSSFHGWLECDDEGAFYLADARSRNSTRLNEMRLQSGLMALREGDEICFGSVRALVCHPATLWDALHYT